MTHTQLVCAHVQTLGHTEIGELEWRRASRTRLKRIERSARRTEAADASVRTAHSIRRDAPQLFLAAYTTRRLERTRARRRGHATEVARVA